MGRHSPGLLARYSEVWDHFATLVWRWCGELPLLDRAWPGLLAQSFHFRAVSEIFRSGGWRAQLVLGPPMNSHRKLVTLLYIATMGVLMPKSVLLAEQESPQATLKSRTEPVLQPVPPPVPDVGVSNAIASGRILRVALDRPLLRLSKLKADSELDGQLFRPVYSGERLLLPEGTKVHLVIDHTEKLKLKIKPPTGILDRVERVRSLRFRAPTTYAVYLRPATLILPDGAKQEMRVSFIRGGDVLSLHPKGSDIKLGNSSITGAAVQDAKDKVAQVKDAKKNAKDTVNKYRHPQVTLRLDEPAVFASLPTMTLPPVQPRQETITIPTGTRARLLLLSNLSTMENKQGESFEARLEEPIQQDGHILLPQGCLFRGHIARVAAPRRLSRAGSMQLVFDSVSMPEGDVQKIVASLSAVEADTKQAVKMDDEGGLKGGSQSKKRAVASAAVAILVGHLIDEATSSPIEAAASTAAGSAVGPIVGVASGVLFYLAAKGKDVEIQDQTELEITFGRPLTIPSLIKPPPASVVAPRF